MSKDPEYFALIICLLALRVALLFKQLVMQTTNYFTAETAVKQLVMQTTNYFTADPAHSAAVVAACHAGTLLNFTSFPHSEEFSTFFAKKRNLFLPLLRTLHLIINLANDFKQKVSLATYGCLFRKGKLRFVSEMWSSTLKVAFLFNNIVK